MDNVFEINYLIFVLTFVLWQIREDYDSKKLSII